MSNQLQDQIIEKSKDTIGIEVRRVDQNNSNRAPYISVVLIDYVNHDFVLDSIDSVLKQDLTIAEFELILVTDSSVSPSVNAIKESHLDHTIIVTDLIPIGSSYLIANQYARGKVICPLDNDDLWERSRLSRIKQKFQSNPKVALYKNAVNILIESPNTHGGLLKRSLGIASNATLKSELKIIPRNASRSDFLRMLRMNPLFNTSSMAFRREDTLSFPPDTAKITSFPESFFFFLLALSDHEMLFDSNRLTTYRVRNESLSKVGFTKSVNSRADNTRSLRIQTGILAPMVSRKGGQLISVLFDSYVLSNQMLGKLRGNFNKEWSCDISLSTVLKASLLLRKPELFVTYSFYVVGVLFGENTAKRLYGLFRPSFT